MSICIRKTIVQDNKVKLPVGWMNKEFTEMFIPTAKNRSLQQTYRIAENYLNKIQDRFGKFGNIASLNRTYTNGTGLNIHPSQKLIDAFEVKQGNKTLEELNKVPGFYKGKNEYIFGSTAHANKQSANRQSNLDAIHLEEWNRENATKKFYNKTTNNVNNVSFEQFDRQIREGLKGEEIISRESDLDNLSQQKRDSSSTVKPEGNRTITEIANSNLSTKDKTIEVAKAISDIFRTDTGIIGSLAKQTNLVFLSRNPQVESTKGFAVQYGKNITFDLTSLFAELSSNNNFDLLNSRIRTALLEELIHYKASELLDNQTIKQISQELTNEDVNNIMHYYTLGGNTTEERSFPEDVIVHEYVRQVTQHLLNGETSEQVQARYYSSLNKLINFLKKVFGDIISIYSRNKESVGSKTIDQLVSNIRNQVSSEGWNITTLRNNTYQKSSLFDDNTKYNTQLKKFLTNSFTDNFLELGSPRRILLSIGLNNFPIIIEKDILKGIFTKHNMLDGVDLFDLPRALNNPVLVFNGNHNASDNNSLWVHTDIKDRNGFYISSIISLKLVKGKYQIKSIYPKYSFHSMVYSNMLFAKKEKAIGYFQRLIDKADTYWSIWSPYLPHDTNIQQFKEDALRMIKKIESFNNTIKDEQVYQLAEDGDDFTTDEEVIQAKDKLKQILPNIPIEVVDDYIKVIYNDNLKAVGMFENGLIAISKKSKNITSTAFHEAFHAVMNGLKSINRDLYEQILNSASKQYNIERSPFLFRGSTFLNEISYHKNKIKGDLAIEERLAEEFQKDTSIQVAKNWWQKLVQWINNMMDLFKNKSVVDKLFKDIRQGKYRDLKLQRSSQEITKNPINYWEEPGFKERNPNFNPEAYINSQNKFGQNFNLSEEMTPKLIDEQGKPMTVEELFNQVKNDERTNYKCN